MAMRNWWITAGCDGRNTEVAFGPGSGVAAGFRLDIWQRDNGQSVKAATIEGKVDKDGRLKLLIDGDGQGLVYTKTTDR